MSSNGNHIALIVAFVVALAVALGLGVWFVAMHNDANDVSRPGPARLPIRRWTSPDPFLSQRRGITAIRRIARIPTASRCW